MKDVESALKFAKSLISSCPKPQPEYVFGEFVATELLQIKDPQMQQSVKWKIQTALMEGIQEYNKLLYKQNNSTLTVPLSAALPTASFTFASTPESASKTSSSIILQQMYSPPPSSCNKGLEVTTTSLSTRILHTSKPHIQHKEVKQEKEALSATTNLQETKPILISNLVPLSSHTYKLICRNSSFDVTPKLVPSSQPLGTNTDTQSQSYAVIRKDNKTHLIPSSQLKNATLVSNNVLQKSSPEGSETKTE